MNPHLVIQVVLENLDLLDFLGCLEAQQVLGFLGKRQLSQVIQADLSMKVYIKDESLHVKNQRDEMKR